MVCHSVHADKSSFEPYLNSDVTRAKSICDQNIYEYTDSHLENDSFERELLDHWEQLYYEPFKGVTTDGNVRDHVYTFAEDDGIDPDALKAAGDAVIATLTPDQLRYVQFPIHARERRSWSTSELYIYRKGIRLEEVNTTIRTAIFALLKATLSPEGYHKALSVMRLNRFLGNLVHAPQIMNELSYNFLLFSHPSTTQPWGYLIYGHHLSLSIFISHRRLIISPTFTGAEPTYIDCGPYTSTHLFDAESTLGLKFMQSLPTWAQSLAHLHHFADERLQLASFRDNQILPFEGLNLSLPTLPPSTKTSLLNLVAHFLAYLPIRARHNRLRQLTQHWSDTYFCWIGTFEDSSSCSSTGPTFYYRIQSPVIVCEFDHCAGVFLANRKPEPFHVHTIVRSPNGGDYGYGVLRREWGWDGRER